MYHREYHDGVGHIETEVVTQAKEFLTIFFFLKFITCEKSRIRISLLLPC